MSLSIHSFIMYSLTFVQLSHDFLRRFPLTFPEIYMFASFPTTWYLQRTISNFRCWLSCSVVFCWRIWIMSTFLIGCKFPHYALNSPCLMLQLLKTNIVISSISMDSFNSIPLLLLVEPHFFDFVDAPEQGWTDAPGRGSKSWNLLLVHIRIPWFWWFHVQQGVSRKPRSERNDDFFCLKSLFVCVFLGAVINLMRLFCSASNCSRESGASCGVLRRSYYRFLLVIWE